MAKSRKSKQKNKFKKGWAASPQHNAQRRIVRMEKNLLTFVKKDENGKIIGVEFSPDATSSANPICSKCGAPMQLKQPKVGDKWQPFWGCSQYSVTRCKGSPKDIVERKPQDALVNQKEDQFTTKQLAQSSMVSNQNQIKQSEIVKQNKQGKLIVNRNIQAESNGNLSWGDVIDIIDEALDGGEYPEEIIGQLNTFRDKIMVDIQVEQGLFEVRRPPKKTTTTDLSSKEPEKNKYNDPNQPSTKKPIKPQGKSNKTKQRALAEQIRQKFKKPAFLFTPTSRVKSTNPKCPICTTPMTKKFPNVGKDRKPFWGCTNYKSTGCKGTRNYNVG